MEGILPLILSIPRLTTTQTSTTIPSLSDHSNTIIFPNHLHHHTLPGYIKRYHTTIHAYLFSILLHSALILPYTILFSNWALLPCISIFKSPSFFSGFNIMSDMDRSSSEDNISVGSQEEANADCKMDFSQDEEDLITRLYNLLGQRWALIAGRIPGRTAEEIEKYCNRRYGSD